MQQLTAISFDKDFLWGVAIAAAQNEGAHNVDGRGESIWDVFEKRTGKIKGGATASEACNFYTRYKDDLMLVKALGFKVFRFSISWSRIFPDGIGKVNKEGVAFYNRVIDECILLGLVPFVTLYHWDLPQALQKEGGWASRDMIKWFSRYTSFCAEAFGDRVKNWIVLNEPMGFTSLGYMLGKHAPGKMDVEGFFSAIHNAVLAQAEGGRIIRNLVPHAYIGTSFSCSEVVPYTQNKEDIDAANRVDILLNRLFIEPTLGFGYPHGDFPLMDKLHMHSKEWKYSKRMQFDFDFIGLQNYFSLTVKHNRLMPYVQASEVKAVTRKVPHTAMGWEINANSFEHMLQRFSEYEGVKDIIVTEGGACFKDYLKNGAVHDVERINYFKQYLTAMHNAMQNGANIKGYFAWTLMDNFEWSEGYKARFGLIYTDFETQLRTIKDSGYWWRDFLKG